MAGEPVPRLDIECAEQLEHYLQRTGRLGPEERPVFRVLKGGVSNRVVLVKREAGCSWVIKQALPKLRVAVDWYSSPDRIRQEALGLRWLRQLTPAGSVPALVFEDDLAQLLAMEAVPEPHENWKQLLLKGQLGLEQIRQFAALLGCIHRGGLEKRDQVARVFADRSFFESLRLEPYYQYTATQVPEAGSFLRELVACTRRERVTLVHGDYSPKNVLVFDGRLVLLDHEVIHFGDPSFDLGFSLTHLLAKGLHVPGCQADFREAALVYWARYRERAGSDLAGAALENRAVRQTLACLLARVAGRSPLEYLTSEERACQRERAVALMRDPPATVPGLVQAFLGGRTPCGGSRQRLSY